MEATVMVTESVDPVFLYVGGKYSLTVVNTPYGFEEFGVNPEIGEMVCTDLSPVYLAFEEVREWGSQSVEFFHRLCGGWYDEEGWTRLLRVDKPTVMITPEATCETA